MANQLAMAGRPLGDGNGQGQTTFTLVGDGNRSASTAESQFQTTTRSAGTYSLMYQRTRANGVSATSTTTFRINGANGNQTLSFAAGVTGEAQDTTHTDVVSNTNLVNFQIAIGAGGTSLSVSSNAVVFSATSNTTKRFTNSRNFNENNSALTLYMPIEGSLQSGASTTEAFIQLKAKTAATLQNMQMIILTNSRGTTDTFKSRIGGADGNLVISLGSNVTGLLEDSTHTDSISSGNLINFSETLGITGGTMNISYLGLEMLTTNSQFHFMASQSPLSTVNASVTNYFTVGGLTSGTTTEADTQQLASIAFTWQNLQINVTANTITANTTLKSRIGAADGNQIITDGSGVTGIAEDTTHTDTVLATSEINYQLITGGTGTSISFTNIASLGVIATATVNKGLLDFF